MSPEQKRLAVVDDALKCLNTDKYKGRSGCFVWLYTPINFWGKSLQPYLLSKDCNTCTVCALGALWVSTIRQNNKVTIDDAIAQQLYNSCTVQPQGPYITQCLGEIFDHKQLGLIEIAFEGGHGMFHIVHSPDEIYSHKCILSSDPQVQAALLWYNTTCKVYGKNETTDRLIAILLNMQDNKGLFEPAK